MTTAHDDEDERIGRYLERLAAFERQPDAPLDAEALRAIAAEVGVSEAALERAARAAIEHRSRGVRALQAHDWPAAVAELRHAVELAPADAEAAWWLGDALRERWQAEGDEADRAASGQAYERSLRLFWRPDAERVRRELAGPRRLTVNKQARGEAGAPTKVGGRRDVDPKLALGLGLGMLAVGIFALLAIVIADHAGGVERAEMARAYDETVARGQAAREATPPPPTTPPTDGKNDVAGKAAELGLPRHEQRDLPLTLVVGEADGLRLDAGRVRLERYAGITASLRLDAWLRWEGSDALKSLAVTLELLDADGKALLADAATLIHDYNAPAWPGDLLPVHIAPNSVSAQAPYASARLRVAGAVHAVVGRASGETMPLRWVVPAPDGVEVVVTAREVEHDAFGSGRFVTRTYGGSYVVENRGKRAIADLQVAVRLLDAAGKPVHQGDNEMIVPTFHPPLRPGDRRVFKVYESGVPAYRGVEFAVQVLALVDREASEGP